MALKYKVGDKVRIKSLDWYNKNVNNNGAIICGSKSFTHPMSHFCDKVVTIITIQDNCYRILEDDGDWYWTDEMIECKVEEEIQPKFKVGDILFYRGETCGYLKVEEIREENGEIRYYETSRNIYLIENDPDVFADKVCSVETEETKPIDFTIKATDIKGKVEVVIPDGYGYEIENDKLYFISKKKEYPNTYEECCELLSLGEDGRLYTKGYKASLIQDFQKLLICRDAYWKIAGEDMGLGKPWEPDSDTEVYNIYHFKNIISISGSYCVGNSNILEFPTEEMRDAFYENFKKDIEKCKKLL